MATSDRLQQMAQRMATERFDEHVDELLRAAGDDLDAIHRAMQTIQASATSAGSPEHVAFALLAAAWRRAADNRRDARDN